MESITQSILQDLLSPQELAVHTASSNGNGVSSDADMNHAQGRQLQFMHNKEEEEQQASDEDGLQVRFVACVVYIVCFYCGSHNITLLSLSSHTAVINIGRTTMATTHDFSYGYAYRYS